MLLLWLGRVHAEPLDQITELDPRRRALEALGEDIPIAGGYTLGQIVPTEEDKPQFLNQHMVVILFGEPEEVR